MHHTSPATPGLSSPKPPPNSDSSLTAMGFSICFFPYLLSLQSFHPLPRARSWAGSCRDGGVDIESAAGCTRHEMGKSRKTSSLAHAQGFTDSALVEGINFHLLDVVSETAPEYIVTRMSPIFPQVLVSHPAHEGPPLQQQRQTPLPSARHSACPTFVLCTGSCFP